MITKSDFLVYLDAPMHLWALKNGGYSQQPPSIFDQHLMMEGQKIEKLANEFLKDWVEQNYQDVEVFYQPSYVDGEFEARADVVVHDRQVDVYDIYEIKSSTKIKKEHRYDATFQTLVCEAELPIRDVYLVHLNKDYVREGQLDFKQLFLAEKINSKVDKLRDEVTQTRAQALAEIDSDSDQIQICHKPNDCPCLELCHPNLPDDSIYEISRLTFNKANQLLENGIETIHQIPADFSLTYKQRQQVKATKENQAIIDFDGIRDDLSQLKYPLYFLDYETYFSGLPLFDGYHPHQQMVFQYSLHVVEKNSEDIKHHEYIATTDDEPSLELVKNLRKNIGDKGSVIVWNDRFESKRNEEMAELHPEYADFLLGMNERMYDLADSFKNCLYVDPAFKGSWSIKNVLPVLVPDLSYRDLDISKGDEAMINWWKMVNGEVDDAEKVKQDLLEYCKLDTWAMVEIWRNL